MTTATSSSDRIATARALADHLEQKMQTAQWMSAAEGIQAVHALRALIEPPAVDGDPEPIFQRAAQTAINDYAENLYPQEDGEYRRNAEPFRSEMENAAQIGYQAGIQAAHESWEPENAPGTRVVTNDEHEAVRRVVLDAVADAEDQQAREPYYYTGRIYDALGLTQ